MTKEVTPLQRYDPIRYSDQGGWSWDTASIKPCDDGEYVKLDDVEAERSALLREVEALRALLGRFAEAWHDNELNDQGWTMDKEALDRRAEEIAMEVLPPDHAPLGQFPKGWYSREQLQRMNSYKFATRSALEVEAESLDVLLWYKRWYGSNERTEALTATLRKRLGLDQGT